MTDARVKATVGGDGNGEITWLGTIVWKITSSGGCIDPGNGGGGALA